jgi:aryl-alcohol dehydrogenase-like predicted oxidoreductase
MQRSPHSWPIPGTSSIGHFDANLGGARLTLSPEDVQRLTDLAPESAVR